MGNNSSNFVDGIETLRDNISDVETVVNQSINHIVSTGSNISLNTSGGSSISFTGILNAPLPPDLGSDRPPLIAFKIDPEPEELPGIAWKIIKDRIKFWKDNFKNASTDISNELKNIENTAFNTFETIEDVVNAPVKTVKEAVGTIAQVGASIPLLPCVTAIDKELHVLSSLLSILKVVLGLLKKITGILKLIFKLPSPLFVVKFILNICGEAAHAIAEAFDKDEKDSTGTDPNMSTRSDAAIATYNMANKKLPPIVNGTGQYYGTGPDGKVGYYNLPAGDEDLMKKSEYDPNRNGVVEEVEWVDGSRIISTGFSKNLGPEDNTVQKCLDKLDQL